MKHKKSIGGLHILLLLYSLSSVCSKFASEETFLSVRFCLFYGASLAILAVYALAWQQILKRLPLTFAYANKAAGLIWNLLWGLLLFHEVLTWKKLLSALCIMGGIVLFSRADAKEGM